MSSTLTSYSISSCHHQQFSSSFIVRFFFIVVADDCLLVALLVYFGFVNLTQGRVILAKEVSTQKQSSPTVRERKEDQSTRKKHAYVSAHIRINKQAKVVAFRK